MPFGRIALLCIACALVFAPSVHSQIQQNAPVDVLGQVYAPGGGPMPHPVRINFSSDNALRPPEIIFTDSNGRFVIYKLAQGAGYTVSVDTDGQNWATTVVRFQPFGRKPTVQIYLLPFRKPQADSNLPSISVASLRSDIPGDARREFEKGMKDIGEENFSKAKKHFEKAVAGYPQFVEARNELAVVLMKDGDLGGAEQHLRQALQTDSTAVLPLMNLGLCIYRQTRYADAALPLERAVQLQPENYRAHLLLGMTWVMAGDDPRAEATLLRAYELGGARAAKAQYYLAHYYTRKKNYTKAAFALQTYLHDAPGDPNAAELTLTLERLRATLAKN